MSRRVADGDYTTGDVARLCKVSINTVKDWMDREGLNGYRIPGSRDRRFERDQVVRFLREKGLPLRGLDNDRQGVALTRDAALAMALYGFPEVRIRVTRSGFELGQLIKPSPALVILDTCVGRSEVVEILDRIRSFHSALPVIVIIAEDDGELNEEWSKTAVFKRPFDLQPFWKTVVRLVDGGQSNGQH